MSEWKAYYYGIEISISDNEMRNFIVGGKIKVNCHGKVLTRRVYDSRDGLYIIIENTKIFYKDFEWI